MSHLLSARQFWKKLAWYPPAETKIPLRSILSAFFSSNGDFGQALCNYLGVEKCILGNSGRALLALLLNALWEKDGKKRDQVLIPAYTCYSVAGSVVRAGLKVNVYDLDSGSFNPDLDDLKRKIGTQTLAVICQHLFGIPSETRELIDIAKRNGSYVIEDVAQALGGSEDENPLGTLGDFGFFSFGRGKTLPLGSGGAMVGEDREIFAQVKVDDSRKGRVDLSSTLLTQLMSLPFLYGIPENLPIGLGKTIFDPKFAVSQMPERIQYLGEKCICYMESLNGHRRTIGRKYYGLFGDHGTLRVQRASEPVYTRFPLMAGRNSLSRELMKLGVRRMYPNAIADEQTIKSYLADPESRTPGASEIARHLITLPTHTGISENLAKQIAEKVRDHYHISQ